MAIKPRPAPRSIDAFINGAPDAALASPDVAVQATLPSVREIDPLRVHRSALGNRVAQSLEMSDPKFAELVASIIHEGRNTVPVIVRVAKSDGNAFEIAAGHRRVAAVLVAMEMYDRGEISAAPSLIGEVRELDDRELVKTMWMENSERADLSPWEIAQTIRSMLIAEGMNQTRAANSLGIKQPQISKYLALTELPVFVLDAFGGDRRRIPTRAREIVGAMRQDAKLVEDRARAIIAMNAAAAEHGTGAPMPTSSVVSYLMKGPPPTTGHEAPEKVTLTRIEGNSFRLTLPTLEAKTLVALRKKITDWIAQGEM